MTTIHREALPNFQSPDEKGKWILTSCLYAIQVLSKKAHDEGYNALVKLKAYEGITTPDEEGVDFIVSGIPAVVASEVSDLVLRPSKQPSHVQTSKTKQQLPKPKHNQPGSHAPRQQQNQQHLHMQSETSKRQHKRRDSYLDDVSHSSTLYGSRPDTENCCGVQSIIIDDLLNVHISIPLFSIEPLTLESLSLDSRILLTKHQPPISSSIFQF